MTGNIHPNGDVDRLYLPRSEGGSGLKSIVCMYEQTNLKSSPNHTKLAYSLFLCRNKVISSDQWKYQKTIKKKQRNYYSKEIIKGIYKGRYRITEGKIKCKMMYGYYEKNLVKDPCVDINLTFLSQELIQKNNLGGGSRTNVFFLFETEGLGVVLTPPPPKQGVQSTSSRNWWRFSVIGLA